MIRLSPEIHTSSQSLTHLTFCCSPSNKPQIQGSIMMNNREVIRCPSIPLDIINFSLQSNQTT